MALRQERRFCVAVRPRTRSTLKARVQSKLLLGSNSVYVVTDQRKAAAEKKYGEVEFFF